MKPYVIGFYGESKTGKTTLIVKIIKELARKGFNVSSIKISDKNICIDKDGKDTYQHSTAGANLVILSAKNETDFLFKDNMQANDIINCIKNFGKYDIIIIEGANDEDTPKIRIGNIKKRKNTILTYDNDYNKLLNLIKDNISRSD